MTWDEMVASCLEALDDEGSGFVTFIVRPGRKPPGFPRGELLNKSAKNVVAWQARAYNARRMLDWLNRPEVVEWFKS